MKPYIRDRNLPTLGQSLLLCHQVGGLTRAGTLTDIYVKVDSGLGKLSTLRKPRESREKLGGFIQVLTEGMSSLRSIERTAHVTSQARTTSSILPSSKLSSGTPT